MAKTIVVINRHKVKANKDNKTNEPVISVRHGRNGRPTYVDHFDFSRGTLVQDFEHPLKCGATVWFEVEDPPRT